MPVVLTDIATICLYAKTFAENRFRLYLDDYYKKSLFDNFRKSNELTDLFNGLASFPDYMKTRHNDGIVEFSKHWGRIHSKIVYLSLEEKCYFGGQMETNWAKNGKYGS